MSTDAAQTPSTDALPADAPPAAHAERPVAVFTGGAGEIGRALTERYLDEGFEVHLIDLAPGLEALAASFGERVVAHRIDVTDEDALAPLLALPQVDVLVNGIGVWPVTPFDELTPSLWKRYLDINLNTAYASTWACREGLRAASGAVVSIGSAVGFKGHPDLAFYSAAKAGVVGMTRSLALALGPDGVRVNAVAPGLVATPFALQNWGAEQEAAFRASRALDVRIETADVVDAIFFLASRAARTITGQTLVVDGGTVLH